MLHLLVLRLFRKRPKNFSKDAPSSNADILIYGHSGAMHTTQWYDIIFNNVTTLRSAPDEKVLMIKTPYNRISS